jgi:Putative lumazine-binding
MTEALSGAPDNDQIMLVFRKYIDGAKSGRSSDMKPAFHEDATIFGYVGESVWGGPIQRFFDYNDKNGPARDIQVRVASIDVANSVATARLEIDNWTGHKYTDLFTLLKVDGEWKIINKVFHLFP